MMDMQRIGSRIGSGAVTDRRHKLVDIHNCPRQDWPRRQQGMIALRPVIRIDAAHGETIMTLSFDRSVALFRQLMAKLMEADSRGGGVGIAAQ
jgi:hypothetical protein